MMRWYCRSCRRFTSVNFDALCPDCRKVFRALYCYSCGFPLDMTRHDLALGGMEGDTVEDVYWCDFCGEYQMPRPATAEATP